jgi:hypothetical protein
MRDAVQPDASTAIWCVTLRPARLLMYLLRPRCARLRPRGWPELNPAAEMVSTARLKRSARGQAAPPTSATVISPPPLGLSSASRRGVR